jgi:O-antigen ligase
MSRSTKLIVIVSNLAAVGLVAILVSRGVPSILVPAVSLFLLSWLSSFKFGDAVIGVVLATLYIFPAACFAWFHTFVFSYYAIWLAALCGAMLPRALGSRWAYPARVSAPLVLWALTLAVSWPLVVLRELDFAPAILVQREMPISIPQLPGEIVVWIASVASIVMTGMLLLDWLFLRDPDEQVRAFEARAIWPLFAGASCAAAVAVYQAVVDISFLNHTFFQGLRRVVGTMRDANAFGAVMALWVPLAAVAAFRAAPRKGVMFAWCGVLVALLTAVWASGSRTALLATGVGLIVVVAHAWRSITMRQRIGGLLGALVVGFALVWLVPSTTVNRLRNMVPDVSAKGLRTVAYQLWSRDMYGTIALKMVEEHPFVGVGVGGFNYQYSDVLFRINGTSRPPDNSQNWYRQQLAELGLLGSIGWITWLVMFAWILVRRPDLEGERLTAGAAEGAVLGLAAASLLGMPTQDAAPSISMVVLMCWCMKLKGLSAAPTPPPGASRPDRREWAAILIVVACFVGGTARASETELRPSLRALRRGTPYKYGFTPDPTDPGIQWTDARAVEVFLAEKRWCKLVIGEVAPDAAQRPVQVTVTLNRKTILQVSRRSQFPVERWMRMPAYGTPLMLQIDVSRTWRPSDFGGPADVQRRGVAVREWSFSDEDPPKGSVTFESADEFLP